MTENLQARLKEIAKECGGNRAICEKSGVSERTFANWLAGSSEPKIIGIADIAEAAGVSIDWIINGTKPKQRLGSHDSQDHDIIKIAWIDKTMKRSDVPLAQRLIVKDHVPFSKDFLERRLKQTDFNNLCILEPMGDSMAPTMRDGDFVLVNRSEKNIKDGLAAFVFKNTICIKRIVNTLNGFEIVSDNKTLYPPQRIEADDLQKLEIIGSVLWVGKTIY